MWPARTAAASSPRPRPLADQPRRAADRGAGGRTATVRRLAGRNSAGLPIWTAAFHLPKTYLFRHCDLAYATTAHAAQGRTVDTSHVLVDGLGDRQGLYVAMSRGRDSNYAYCITRVPRATDVRQG